MALTAEVNTSTAERVYDVVITRVVAKNNRNGNPTVYVSFDADDFSGVAHLSMNGDALPITQGILSFNKITKRDLDREIKKPARILSREDGSYDLLGEPMSSDDSVVKDLF